MLHGIIQPGQEEGSVQDWLVSYSVFLFSTAVQFLAYVSFSLYIDIISFLHVIYLCIVCNFISHLCMLFVNPLTVCFLHYSLSHCITYGCSLYEVIKASYLNKSDKWAVIHIFLARCELASGRCFSIRLLISTVAACPSLSASGGCLPLQSPDQCSTVCH